MIRALHVFSQYLNPTENWCFRLIRNLPDTQVVIGAKQFLQNGFFDPRFEFVEFPFRAWDRPRKNIVERAANAFISHALLPLYPRWLAAHAGPVDIVHAHFGYMGWEYRKTAQLLGAPLVVSFYGADYSRLPRAQPVWRERYRELFHEMALALCEGEHGRRQLIELGCPPEKVRVLHLGIEPVDVANSRDWKNAEPKLPVTGSSGGRVGGKMSGALRLVQVATMREKKGHIFTARAFREALRDCPNLTLTFAGGDAENLRGGIEEALGESASRVTFLEGVDFSRLHEFLSGFDVFIHPSVHAANGDCEGGAPVVLLDAQAVGLPVIATRHCDIPEEVRDGETGILADERDVAGLAAAIRKCYAMGPDEFADFSARAAAHVAADYDALKNAEYLRTIYDGLRAPGVPRKATGSSVDVIATGR